MLKAIINKLLVGILGIGAIGGVQALPEVTGNSTEDIAKLVAQITIGLIAIIKIIKSSKNNNN